MYLRLSLDEPGSSKSSEEADEKWIQTLLNEYEQEFEESMLDAQMSKQNFSTILEISHPDTLRKYIRFVTIYDNNKKKRYIANKTIIIKLKPGVMKELIQWLVTNGLVYDYSIESVFD